MPSIFTFDEPLSTAPSGDPRLFTIFVTEAVTLLITPPSSCTAYAPSAKAATEASPPVPITNAATATVAATAAAATKAPATTPASAARKLVCWIGSPSRAAAGPFGP
ncbi:hypothetical protein [Xenorhabdus bovienii]|uniref:hypothetical protein n=1 Tax=Xenorhabdus bovienii TaxID=40576 RepID=UPI003DA1E300